MSCMTFVSTEGRQIPIVGNLANEKKVIENENSSNIFSVSIFHAIKVSFPKTHLAPLQTRKWNTLGSLTPSTNITLSHTWQIFGSLTHLAPAQPSHKWMLHT